MHTIPEQSKAVTDLLKGQRNWAGQYINIVSYRDMKRDIETDFGYRYIVIWR